MTTNDFPSELFLPFLNQSSELPQYALLFRAFQQAILQGDLIPGAKLPASRPLSTTLKVSRNTVKAAYEMLQAEGYIETRQGAGSFVSEQVPDQSKRLGGQSISPSQSNANPALSDMAMRMQHYQSTHSSDAGELLAPAKCCTESFPWNQWQKQVTKAARQMKFFPSNSVMGNDLLRGQIANYLQVTRGVHCDPEQVMICSGSQHALYLSFQLLLNSGDTVWLEDPGYHGISGALASVGATAFAVPTDTDGFDLPYAINHKPTARAALVTPSHNYPMGFTLSLERRLALIDWAKQQGTWIIEDDYDSEFRYEGPPLTALQGLGGEDCVIYAGTFTRILHPSIRLGYLVTPKRLIEPFNHAKRYIDGGISQLPQLALGEFMASGQFASHVRRMRKLYQHRREVLNQAIEDAFTGTLQRIAGDGGMHSVYLLDSKYNDVSLCKLTNQQGLGIRALSNYYQSDEPQQGLVIGFAGFNDGEIQRGVTLLQSSFERLTL
ncbi:MAG: PLP-dependent aminotransferase family protein [Leucothrix sp.]